MNISKLENFPSVYYVSLEESIDRQKNLEKQFAEYNIVPTSIISKRFAESTDEITGKFLDQMNGGTTGCVVSHLKAIRKWYEETDEDYAFFCEDDLSLETVEYWDFTWEEFIETIPDDVMCIQLLVIRKDYETFDLRQRLWDDWAGTAYIITRDYAKILIDSYCRGENKFHLEIPGVHNVLTPLLENILFETLEQPTYTIPLFVEDVKFATTFSPDEDKEVVDSQKRGHYEAREIVLNYWKNKMNFLSTEKKEEQQNKEMNPIEVLLTEYANDPENAENNFNLGAWYWDQKHTAPALSYFLRCAERAQDQLLAYEALLWSHLCYEKQGTRDATARTLLQHAICTLPNRPEAYYLLAKFHSKRQQWTDAYVYANQGIDFSEKDLVSFRTDIGYSGEYALLYEKAISGWWWGKSEESKNILLDLKNNYTLNEFYEKNINDQLVMMKIFVNKISDIFDKEKYNTDKNDLGYFENFYDTFMIDFKNIPINFMEIGVYNGGSIKLWKDYLHKDSSIYAADINYFDHIEGTYSLIGDMYSDELVSKFEDNYFDLIIDDGPHSFESFILVMQKYFNKIKLGGRLVIEDIINPSWVKPLFDLSYSLGYSSCEIIDMTKKQKTDELFERWKNGLYILKITK